MVGVIEARSAMITRPGAAEIIYPLIEVFKRELAEDDAIWADRDSTIDRREGQGLSTLREWLNRRGDVTPGQLVKA